MDFCVEQRNDKTLSQAFEQVVMIADEEVDALHFALKADFLLYLIDQDKQTQEIRTTATTLGISLRIAASGICNPMCGTSWEGQDTV